MGVCEGRKWHLHKLHDEKGLFAIIRPTGGKLSRFKYRQQGKEQQLSLGTYPEGSLKDARQRRDEVRQLLAEGKDPGAEKKRAKLEEAISAGNTFKALHTRPIADIEPIELLAELRKVENVGHHEAARQVRAFASRVFCFGVATTRCKQDVSAPLVKALTMPKVTHRAAIVDPVKVGQLLRAIEGFEGQITTKLALRLALHVFARPGELRYADWSEVDSGNAKWISRNVEIGVMGSGREW